jgi:hypothetical protein
VEGLEPRPPLDGGGIPIALDNAAFVILSSSSLQAEVTGTTPMAGKGFILLAL